MCCCVLSAMEQTVTFCGFAGCTGENGVGDGAVSQCALLLHGRAGTDAVTFWCLPAALLLAESSKQDHVHRAVH